MSAPRWSQALLRRLAPRGREDEILGDLEEAHGRHVRRRGRLVGAAVSALDTLDMAFALLRERLVAPPASWLDVKLAFRMLVRYPGLTALGGVAIAFAIFTGAGTFEFLSQVAYPQLPFEDGDRMVVLDLLDAEAGDDHARVLYDYGVWREELTTVEELGAFDSMVLNLIVEDRGAHPVTGAVMSGSGFRLTGVEPLLGRALTPEDARPGAPLVVVLGHGTWSRVFGADPGVLGEVVRIGGEEATVVGVMPEGFTFPSAHELWLPLRTDPSTVAPGEGPTVVVFGRLAHGASRERAQAELAAVQARLAAAHPATHGGVRGVVRPYGRGILGLPGSVSEGLVSALVLSWNLPLLLFLLLVCGNVALLLSARASARQGELVVRSALGAGRRRIVGQLFVEALVLAGVGAFVGLVLAGWGLRWGYHVLEIELLERPLPFWFDPSLSVRTVSYAAVLTLVAALVAGVVPGLKATRGLGGQLKRAAAGGGGFRFGGLWTVVIVSQIAVTVVIPVVTIGVGLEGRDIRTYDLGIPAHDYLTASVAFEPPADDGDEPGEAGFVAARREVLAELESRLLADARVAGVTFAKHAPRMYTGWHQIEVDGPTAPPMDERGHRMGSVRVAPDFFRTLGIEPRAGRDFTFADAGEGSTGVIVNEAFVDYVLDGRHAVGVTFRYVAAEGVPPDSTTRYEVVGVVQDLGSMSGYGDAVVYHPSDPAEMGPLHAIVHVRGDAAGFGPRLMQAAFRVDPTLRVRDVTTLDRVVDDTVSFYRFWFWLLVALTGVGVLLSLGAIYSVMSFTVSRRTREIGIRVALGAPRSRIVLSVFRRPLIQVALGIVAGAVLTAAARGVGGDTAPDARELAHFAAYLVVVTSVCLTACVVPTRRALVVEPSEALRAE